jgi:hypothetical protein
MAREQPAQTYFPRARVRLIVRFEEFGRVTSTPKPLKKPPHLRKDKGVDNKEGGLSAVKQGNAFLLLAPSQKQGNPTTLGTSSADQRTFVIEGVLPVRFGINRNRIRTGYTCSIEINYRDLTTDPRVVRACGVQVYLGTITQEQYEREALGGPQGAPIIETDWIDDAGRKRSNLRFEGWVDEWRVSHLKGAISTVSLKCTDNTRILIAQDAPPKLVVAADKPLDQAVADYLANFPQSRGFRVEHRPPGAAVPQLDQALGKLATKKKGGPPPAGGAGTAKLAVRDYLTDIAGSLGLIVRLEEVTSIFQRARTLYGSAFSGRPEDPFSGRILPSGRQINSRLFVYGRNIDDLDLGRKIARFAAFNVEVRCFDPAQGRTLIARFPTKEDRQARLLPGDSANEKWTVHTVSDEATLQAIAQGIYEGVGRQELRRRQPRPRRARRAGGRRDRRGDRARDPPGGRAGEHGRRDREQPRREGRELHAVAALRRRFRARLRAGPRAGRLPDDVPREDAGDQLRLFRGRQLRLRGRELRRGAAREEPAERGGCEALRPGRGDGGQGGGARRRPRRSVAALRAPPPARLNAGPSSCQLTARRPCPGWMSMICQKKADRAGFGSRPPSTLDYTSRFGRAEWCLAR